MVYLFQPPDDERGEMGLVVVGEFCGVFERDDQGTLFYDGGSDRFFLVMVEPSQLQSGLAVSRFVWLD